MRVLIADDSDLFVERLVAALDRISGIEIVGHAATAEEASQAIRNLHPDAVILDLCMPGGSGIDVLRGLRKDQLTPSLIVLTGYGESQYRRKCLELGAAYFFDKTTEFGKVSEVLRMLAAGAPAPHGPFEMLTGRQQGAKNLPPAGCTCNSPGRQEPCATLRTPSLIVSRAGKGEPIYYICSHCLRGFPLSEDQPPKEAMKDMYDSFRKHVENAHAPTPEVPTVPA